MERYKNIAYSWAILGMELILSFLALMFIQEWENNLRNNAYSNSIKDKIKQYAPIAIAAIVTNIINFILGFSMDVLATKLERHKAKSDRLTSLIVKNVITQTINTSLMYWIISLR